MTSYFLETLGDERFQKLCQAILTREFPDVQCLPVGQPDGGRDGFQRLRSREQNGFAVYQVKYVKDPLSREARDEIQAVIKTEREKVLRLIERGASSYYLMTNVAGTAHDSVGSVDKVNAELSSAFNIPTFCFWRDDIERRIDNYPAIKWSFPEILKATDLLQSLLDPLGSTDIKRRSDILKTYMSHQARYDAQLKFKQIDLQKNIVDLFVDVPARVIIPGQPSDPTGHWAKQLSKLEIDEEVEIDDDDLESPAEEILARSPGALRLLVNDDLAEKFAQVVVEGAPGQGKSTVTQYLCQVHRLVLLGRYSENAKVAPKHRPSAARIPFRIDLRDYASWLTGRDPFSNDPLSKLPTGSNPILESFLAAQVSRYTGNTFTVDDLSAVSQVSQLVIVLDGFDEVADTGLRNRIVNEVSDAATRICELAISAQIIVTSRPAAFVNSPGFPVDQWQHIQLLPLSRSVIRRYADKWLDGRSADQRERRDVMIVLNQKLGQSHVRDLARNPMQLTILLNLISIQGASLPDKRTALYDAYIDIFLNRESEKSHVVRDHRDLLIRIHRFLAWTLQGEAEISGAGHIAESRLKVMLRDFLENAGHSSQLVEQLFSGIVERVVALVSRVQGTFEFEVQPLREYFAARYLYDTAPYSPPGVCRKGTLPERFDVIARNFYWLNVTRFYAGCYSSGELASLQDRLDELNSSDEFCYLSHGTKLGMILLADHVFSQHPKLATKLVSNLVGSTRFQLLLSQLYSIRSDEGFLLQSGSAQAAIVDYCKSRLKQELQSDERNALARVLILNSSQEELRTYWLDVRPIAGDLRNWFVLGAYFSVFEKMPLNSALELAEASPIASRFFLEFGRIDVFEKKPVLWDDLLDQTLDCPNLIAQTLRRFQAEGIKRQLISKVNLLQFHFTKSDLTGVPRQSLRMLLERVPQVISEESDGEGLKLSEDKASSALVSLNHSFDTLFDSNISDLSSDITLWSQPLEEARAIWGTRWALCRIAVLSAAINTGSASTIFDLTDESASICERALGAWSKSHDKDWWKSQLLVARDSSTTLKKFILLLLHRCGSLELMMQVTSEYTTILDSLAVAEWSSLLTAIEPRRIWRKNRDEGSKSESVDISLIDVGPRAACFLLAKRTMSNANEFWRRFLMHYRGADTEVHQMAVQVGIESVQANSTDWDALIDTIAVGYAHGAYCNLRAVRNTQSNESSMPIAVAKKVCSSAHSYPLDLISFAESTLATQVGADAIPVITIAERDGWFSCVD